MIAHYILLYAFYDIAVIVLAVAAGAVAWKLWRKR